MNTESTNCPQCGTELPSDAPQGLCPRCLAALNFDTETIPVDSPVAAKQPLSPEELAPHFPQLEILECLGRGGMGVVYKARQKSLNRLVALKLLAPERSDDAQFAARFEKEAHALAALNHPHIVTIHDFGQAGDFYYLLMEFVDGVNLRQAMSTGRFKPEEALAIVPPVCEALQYAHEHGIVHRDIKPENLLMDKDGRVKIADFGIAKIVARASSVDLEGGEPGEDLRTTTVGTPAYAAPEQQNDPTHVDHRADIYSLGVVLYELLTGELPKGDLKAPSSRVQIDVRLDEIVLRALEVHPDRRYSTAEEFRTQLATLVPGSGGSGGGAPKSDNCFISTPEHLSSFWGSLSNIYTGKGHLLLDRGRLTFNPRDGEPVVIPVASILDLSIGQYPAAAKPVSLDFISLTFDEGGARRQFLFTPNRGALMPTWETNRIVGDWFKAIQDATRNATGTVPSTTPADQLGVPQGSTMKWLPALAVLAGAGLLFTGLISHHSGQMMLGILVMIAGPILVGLLLGSREAFEGHTPTRRPFRLTGILLLALGAALLLGAKVLNEIVDDFALTATAREHLIKRDTVVEQSASARAEASAKVSERDAAQARLQSSTDPDEQTRLRREFEMLDQESQRLHQAVMRMDQVVNQAAEAKERAEQHRIALFYLIAFALLLAGLTAFYLLSREKADSATPRRRGLGCMILCVMAVAGAVALIAVWSYQVLGYVGGTLGRVTRVTSELVSVEGNTVTVELGLQVSDGPVEVRAELNGSPAPDDKRLPLVDSDRNTGQRTLVLPGAPIGNQPWRIFQPGMHLWRLRYVLPTPELAREAAGVLRPMGELPAGYAGTVFQVGDTAEPDCLALLTVSEVMTSADPDWIEVVGQRSWNETSLRALWTIRGRQTSTVNLLGNDDHQTADLEFNPKTKFQEVPVTLQLDRIGKDRVRITKEVGSSSVTSDTVGDYLALRDEILDTALNSTKSRRGVSVELCRLDGDRLMLNLPIHLDAPKGKTLPRLGATMEYSGIGLVVLVVVLAIVITVIVLVVRKQRKQGRTGCFAAGIAFVAFALLSVVAVVLLYFQMARVEGPEPAQIQEAPASIAPRLTPESPPIVPDGR